MNDLEIACKEGNLKKVKKLLSKGVDASEGYPLKEATTSKNLKIIELLLKSGIDPNSQTAFYSSCYYGNIKVVKLFLKYGVTLNEGTLIAAVSQRHTKVVKLLLRKGSDPFIITSIHDKNKTLYFIIKNNLWDLTTIEKNKDKIPQEVWTALYAGA